MSNGVPDPDDFFAETRMSFGDHIEELRLHLWRAIIGFCVALFFSFFIGKPVLRFISAPVEEQLAVFYKNRQKTIEEEKDKQEELVKANNPTDWVELAVVPDQFKDLLRGDIAAVNDRTKYPKPHTKLGEKPTEEEKRAARDEETKLARIWVRYERPVDTVLQTQEAQMLVGRRPALSTLNIQEAFMVYIKVSLVCGFVLGSPWIFWQIWSFIAAGLYPHERRYVNVYLPFSLGLFLAGVLICQFLVMPRAIEALLWFNEWIGLEPDLRLNEWLSFAIMMPVVFGLSFQTPLVMLFLNRIGIAEAQTYRDKRRLIWFVLVVFAAIITPSTDPWSLLLLWVPMCLLFELGIILCVMKPRHELEDESSESEELIGV